jgi:hypothetical protein
MLVYDMRIIVGACPSTAVAERPQNLADKEMLSLNLQMKITAV